MDVDNVDVDIMTGKKLSSIKVANIEKIYWSVRSSRRGKGGVHPYFSHLQVYSIRVHNNLV